MSEVVAGVGEVSSFRIEKSVEIAAPIGVAFEALLDEVGPRSEFEDGSPMPLVLEAWPGGRWYRDLGEGKGHLWGHVQVIKAPTLLEVCGPLFMSYAATSHVQWRLREEGGVTRLSLVHTAIGLIDPDHRVGVDGGWAWSLERVGVLAAERLGG